jgi:hypothetical protein
VNDFRFLGVCLLLVAALAFVVFGAWWAVER